MRSQIERKGPLILENIRLGMLPKAAALAAGISKRTFEEWKLRGKGKHRREDPHGIYARFLEQIDTAEAEAVERALKTIRRAMKGKGADSVNAAKWLLSKLDPATYGDRVEVRGHVEHRKTYRFKAPEIPEPVQPRTIDMEVRDAEGNPSAQVRAEGEAQGGGAQPLRRVPGVNGSELRNGEGHPQEEAPPAEEEGLDDGRQD